MYLRKLVLGKTVKNALLIYIVRVIKSRRIIDATFPFSTQLNEIMTTIYLFIYMVLTFFALLFERLHQVDLEHQKTRWPTLYSKNNCWEILLCVRFEVSVQWNNSATTTCLLKYCLHILHNLFTVLNCVYCVKIPINRNETAN